MITQDQIQSRYFYNPETGNLISKRTGQTISKHDSDGYLRVNILGTSYLVHRVIWLYMTGQCPKSMIDHINRVRDDNRWCNLRLVSPSCNQFNKTVLGVSFHKGTNRWRARIKLDGTDIYLGSFIDKEDAIAARTAMKLKLLEP